MLQIYNPNLCKKIIQILGLVATVAIFCITAISFITLPSDIVNFTLLQESVVEAIVLSMVGLTLINKLQIAGAVWGFTMPLLLTWIIYQSRFASVLFSALLVVIIIGGVLMPPRLVIICGVLEFILFLFISILFAIQFPALQPVEQFRNVVITSIFILFTTFAVAVLDEGMLRVLRRVQQQSEQLQKANVRLRKQRALQQQTGVRITELTTTLGDVFHKQTSSTREQVLLVNQVASTTQQLDSAARRIADSALAVATVAEKALKSVEAGRKIADEGTQAILGLRNRVERITQSVRALDNQVERISEVTNIIGEIASETQLLALNATIEAAGAREFGRRFAAVAEEVNRLARRVSEAVEQIQETVTEVTQASSQSLIATEEGLRQAEQGTELVERLNGANADVISLVNQTSILASSIASATQEQHNASTQIVDAVHSISGSANFLAEGSDQVSKIVSALETTLKNFEQLDGIEPTNGATSPGPEDSTQKTNENLTYSTARTQ